MEVYYKNMENQIEYEEGYTPNTLDDYGEQLYIRQRLELWNRTICQQVERRLTGWIGYTLSWTWRQFPALNLGEKYPAKYEPRNDMSVVAIYELNKRWKLSGTFVFGNGQCNYFAPTILYSKW
jgi:hypothetical protein